MRRALLSWLAAAAVLAALPAAAPAAPDPFVFTPQRTETVPVPPVGNLEGPCGLAVDTSGNFYVADYGHGAVDRFSPSLTYTEQLVGTPPPNGPCGLAVYSPTGSFLVNEMHGAVIRYTSLSGAGRTILDPGPATGVAIDFSNGRAYVDDGDHVSVYGPGGAPIEVSGHPLTIGSGSLGAGYGIAVSGYPATQGYVYVPDAASNTVKVYDPATNTATPVQTLAIAFTSLRDSAIAVDDATGEVYVVDDLQPGTSNSPEATVDVFKATGEYEGRLKYNIIDARPPGLAVDNSGGGGQSRVYVTTGNTESASVMLYQPHSAGSEAAAALPGPKPSPPGQGAEAPLPEPPLPVTCEGDSCQHLPSEPRDPTLTTLLEAAGDGPIKYFDTNQVSHVVKLRHHRHKGARRKGAGGKGAGGKGGKRTRSARGAMASASSSSIMRRGNLQLKVSGSIAPKRLPREASAPISVSVAGDIATTDQSPPPQLDEVELELNRYGHLETTGLPLCRVGQIHPASTARALAECRRSLVGSGRFGVDVVLAGQEPYATSGRLLLFNGTYQHKHALLGQIYSDHPFANSFVIPFVINQRAKGRYGLVLNAKLPQALISWGRVTSLDLKLSRRYAYAGRQRSFVNASCPAPKGFTGASFTLARATFRFADARTLSQIVTDQCQVRG